MRYSFCGQSGNHGSSPGGGKAAGYQPFNHEKLSGGDGARQKDKNSSADGADG